MTLNLANKRFYRLIALKRIPQGSDQHSKWLCQCDCGNITYVQSSHLMTENVRSCGCLQKETYNKRTLPFGEASFNSLYQSYKTKSAEKRNLVFEITKEQFRKLTSGNCYYCGQEPNLIKHQARFNGFYKYNGIDRVNNDKGYTLDNCVPCCHQCNSMKEKLTLEEFINHINKIYNYQKKHNGN